MFGTNFPILFQYRMRIILSILFFCIADITSATTYYISTAGSDASGTGTISNPWKTLFKATSTVFGTGDIIHVNSGTYTETAQCVLAVGVSIEGDDSSTCIIKSTLTAAYTEILNCRSAEGTNGNQHISNLKFDGQNLATFWGVYISGRSNVSVYNVTFVNFLDGAIYFTGRDDNVESAPSIFAIGNSFYNSTILNCASFDGWGRGCLSIGGQNGMLIYNNFITQNQRAKGANGWPIKYYNGGYIKEVKIYNNTLIKNEFSGAFLGDGDWDFAIELWSILGGVEIYNNTITGDVDLDQIDKTTYAFSVWVHHNTISHPSLNSIAVQGITLEHQVNGAIIENNLIRNVGVAICFVPRVGNAIDQIKVENNICENIGVLNKSHLGFAIIIGQDGNSFYSLSNLFVYKNKFIASTAEKPYWGIGILGALKVNNVQIIDNIIQNFSAGCIVASPAVIIDTLTIKNNTLSGNGNANMPAFSTGAPHHYIFKNNISSNPFIFSFINLKMNIIRPFYYALKSTGMLVFVAVFAGIFSLWFSRKENIYVYPMGLIYILITTFLNFDQQFLGEIVLNFYFIIMCIYGWFLWLKRDNRKHRIIRITQSVKKEWLLHLAFFLAVFLILYFCYSYFKKEFTPNAILLADALATTSAFLAIWLMVRKKIESWYWWIISNTTLILLYFIKNYLFYSAYHFILLFMSIAGLYGWKNRKYLKRK